MTNKVIHVPPATPAGNPFQRAQNEHLAAGTIAIEAERAIAEAQGKLIIAKKFPRDEAAAFDKVMRSCSRPTLASQAFYSFPRGKETVSGISIRLAEELARAWGNIDFGLRELSNKPGESEMEAYCWDLETNTYSSQKFTVKHERHTKQAKYNLTDPRDVYELTANQGARRLRARILAVLPPDLIEAAEETCRRTLAGPVSEAEPKEVTIQKLAGAFAKYAVTQAMIEERFQTAIEELTIEQITELRGIFLSIRDNMSSVSEWFVVESAPSVVHKLNQSAVKQQPSGDDEEVAE